MAPPPTVVAVLAALLALGSAADTRHRRALVYFTQHPTGTSTSSRTGGVSSSAYYATGPSALLAGPPADPAALPLTSPPLGLTAGFSNDLSVQDALQNPDSPYGNVPPPPPPPPGPAPPYTVNAARGLTYDTAPQAPPLRTSYAPSQRITFGRRGVLARVGYTAPPIAQAAPALLFTSAKDGGLAGQDQPFESYEPAYSPTPYTPYTAPPYAPRPSFGARPYPSLFSGSRGGRVFRPSQPDPSGPAPAPYNGPQFNPVLGPPPPGASLFSPLAAPPSGPPSALFTPLTAPSPAPAPYNPFATPPPLPPQDPPPPRNPADPAPLQFVQSFVPPPVSPILLSRNRGGEAAFYQGPESTNYLR